MKELTLLIPAYKEVESLPTFLEELKSFDCKKLIVLQGDDQETLESISNFDDIEICIQKKKGYGSALIEGIDEIKTEFFCIINADGSMNPIYLKEMLDSCKNEDFVFASRYSFNGKTDDDTILTYIGNKIFSAIGNIFFQLGIDDILYTYVMGKTKSFQHLELKNLDLKQLKPKLISIETHDVDGSKSKDFESIVKLMKASSFSIYKRVGPTTLFSFSG